MPITPLHWSVALLGFIFFNFFYLPALFISSVLMDLEPLYFLFNPNAEGILHGFFHTYVGVTMIALVVAFLLVKYRKQVDEFAAIVKIQQPSLSREKIIFSSLVAAWSHVFLDSFLYADITPFWPLTAANPFFGTLSISQVYIAVIVGLVVVLALWVSRFLKK